MSLLGIITLILLVTFPFFGLIGSIFLYLKAKTPKQIVLFSILFGALFGFFAFNLTPENTFDIVSHHEKVEAFRGINSLDGYLEISKNIDLEPVPNMLSFIASRFENANILQFIVATIGYSLLLYVLADYKNKKNLNQKRFLPILFLIIFGQSTLYYFSGLYNYLAINIFAFAFYLDYGKKKKITPYILYILTVFVHSGMVMPLAVLLFYKLIITRNRSIFFMIASIASVTLVMFFSTEILSFFIKNFNFSFLTSIRDTLSNYIVKDIIFQRFYHGFGLMVDISKIIFSIGISLYILKKDKKRKEIGYIIMFAISTLFLLTRTVLMARFAALVLFLSIVPIMDTVKDLNTKNKKDVLIMYIICGLALIYTLYCIKVVMPYELEVPKNILFNTFTISGRGV